MNDKILDITIETCGTCRFAQGFSQGMADCHGLPPTILNLGVNERLCYLEAFVPKVKSDRPACSLYRRKIDFPTQGCS
jgi:hypothetical protein